MKMKKIALALGLCASMLGSQAWASEPQMAVSTEQGTVAADASVVREGVAAAGTTVRTFAPNRSYVADLVNPAAAAAIFEGIATNAAIHQGVTNHNPFWGGHPSPEAIIAVTAAKILLTPAIRRLDDETRVPVMGATTGIFAGLGVGNLLLATGALHPVAAVGAIAAGWFLGDQAAESEKKLIAREHGFKPIRPVPAQ